MAAYLRAQARAGAQALMLFESWAGLLATAAVPADSRCGARSALWRALRALGVPIIYYANQGSALMEEVRALDVDVDRRGLAVARWARCARILGRDKAIQGNLDPAALFAAPEELQRADRRRARGRRPRRLGISSTWVTASGRIPIRMPSRGSLIMSMSAPAHSGCSGDLAGRSRRLLSRLAGAHLRAFEILEEARAFTQRAWSKPEGHRLQGGGERRLMRGEVFEKVGVNFSHVWGALQPQFRSQIAGAEESEGSFTACGISLVAHMYNPYVPAVHMNLRYLCTSRAWFGGGSDLTPTFPFDEDTADFHAALHGACDTYRAGCLSPNTRSDATGIFICRIGRNHAASAGFSSMSWRAAIRLRDFAFVRAVGEAFLGVFPKIVARRKDEAFDARARDQLLVKRGRYVEFNLVYDRGTQFGFGTDADPEAYLMSLPPLVRW